MFVNLSSGLLYVSHPQPFQEGEPLTPTSFSKKTKVANQVSAVDVLSKYIPSPVLWEFLNIQDVNALCQTNMNWSQKKINNFPLLFWTWLRAILSQNPITHQAYAKIINYHQQLEHRGIPLTSCLRNVYVRLNYSEGIIEKVASFVSRVYAILPRLGEEERIQLRKKGIINMPKLCGAYYEILPSEKQSAQFEESLKQMIITSLTHEECYKCSVQLSVDYAPEGSLSDVFNPIVKTLQFHYHFPHKSCTRISLIEKKSQLVLSMRFG